MEKRMALPLADLFGQEVVIKRRTFVRRKTPLELLDSIEQMGFLDILEMSEEELERQRTRDEVTDDYIDWLRSYIMKITLRQLLHRQVSEANRREAHDWLMDDAIHPFSFRVCCEAFCADFQEVRESVLAMIRRYKK